MRFENLRYKRWPFVESPGDFTDRLGIALHKSLTPLAAVRHVMIEEPPTISAEYLALAHGERAKKRYLTEQGKGDIQLLFTILGWVLAATFAYAWLGAR